MSLQETRAGIVAALSRVDDVHGHLWRPVSLNPGDAWATFGSAVRDRGTSFAASWAILIISSQDDQTAAEWFDQHWADLFYALEKVGSVQGVEPVLLSTSSGDLKAFRLTLICEE